MLPEDYFNGLYKFAVVRNPWDLHVSSYHHIKRERPHVMKDHEPFKWVAPLHFDVPFFARTSVYQPGRVTSLGRYNAYL